MSDIKKLHIDELKKRFDSYDTISVDDFNDFYKDVYGEIKRNTVSWLIYKLKKSRVIRNVSRGQYVLEEDGEDLATEYVVITMDIIKSSEMNYKKFNLELSKKVKELNLAIKHSYNYEREFFISQGDEIQIIYPFGNEIVYLFIITLSYLRPFKVRYGVSFGMSEGELKRNSWEMNGPIFWNARDCLTKLKNSKDYDGLVVSEHNYPDKLCNNILSLINKTIRRITDKQWDAIRFELSKKHMETALEELKISKTSYYDRLYVSNLEEIIKSLETIVQIMKKRRLII
ncbi:MAG: SatD family protein [Tepidibacter sp.]|uniref:SatD family protein n=1 Tax=Tepidibacter sp. TaxID=2529387 RepID=UPI0025DF0E95|nr:SatD family protein [Tepidibacter sp.]MCT4508418.1 SatD family protein [Tepidibacter sp.]